jgi:integrase
LLPNPKKLGDRHHHAAMPWPDLPAFMAKLRAAPGEAAVALQLIVLTAARAGEVLRMTWDEVDLDKAIWTIPPSRMKAGVQHEVPLSDAAMEILRARFANVSKPTGFVFPSPMPLRDPGVQTRKALSNQSLMDTLDRLGAGDYTVHGLRASFKTYCGDHGVPRELAERALAHRVGNAVEAAYDRTDLLERRRPLMQQWAEHLAGNVVPMIRRA